MFKKTRLVAIVLIAMILLGTVPQVNVYGLSESEPNNTITQATKLKFGQEYTGTTRSFSMSGGMSKDDDFFKLVIPEDGYIVMTSTLNGTGTITPTITISKDGKEYYYTDEYYWAFYDTFGVKLKSSKIGLPKGTYYLKIDGDCKYNVKVDYVKGEFEKEFNDDIKKAIPIKVNKTYKGSYLVNSGTDYDWYKVTVPKDGYITLNYKKSGPISPTVYLYDVNQKVLALDTFNYNSKDVNVFKTHKIGVKRGTYYVYTYEGAREDEGNEYNFTVNFTASGYWEAEPNSSIAQSKNIKINTWYYGTVDPRSSDTDFFKFTLSKDSEIRIDINHPKNIDTIYEFDLYDSNRNALTSRGYAKKSISAKKPGENNWDWYIFPKLGDSPSTSTVKLKRGTYYIRLYTYAGSAGGTEYSFRVNNGTARTAINKATVTGVKDKTYTGQGVGQNPTVKIGNTTLKKGTDYTLSYKNNVNVGTATVTVTGKGKYTGTVSQNFKITKGFVRASGKSRYQTAIAIGNKVKALNGNKKFNYIIVASGQNYPDALGGAYLAKVKNAPILLTTDGRETDTINFIKKSLNKGGTVYVLGGAGAVSNNFTKKLKSAGIRYSRQGGRTRYDTNVLTLKAAGIKGKNLIVCTGKDFPDALISSAVGNPIMIVTGDKLTDSQTKLLKQNKVKSVTIVSTGKAVSTKLDAALKKASGVKVSRVTASSRYALSKTVADKYFKSPKNVVIATGKTFPDALSGGPLAIKLGAPILLADSSNSSYAKSYIKSKSVKQGYILGGTGAVSSSVERSIM